jgi:hypothetical protein
MKCQGKGNQEGAGGSPAHPFMEAPWHPRHYIMYIFSL